MPMVSSNRGDSRRRGPSRPQPHRRQVRRGQGIAVAGRFCGPVAPQAVSSVRLGFGDSEDLPGQGHCAVVPATVITSTASRMDPFWNRERICGVSSNCSSQVPVGSAAEERLPRGSAGPAGAHDSADGGDRRRRLLVCPLTVCRVAVTTTSSVDRVGAHGEQGQLGEREVGDVGREVVASQRQDGAHPAGRILDGVRVVQVVPGVGEVGLRTLNDRSAL